MYSSIKVAGLLTYDLLKSILEQYGWKIKNGQEQKKGSCADIYAVFIDPVFDIPFSMLIDDGTISIHDAVTHIFAGSSDSKIFEGCITTENDLNIAFKILGFKKHFDVISTTTVNDLAALLDVEEHHKLYTQPALISPYPVGLEIEVKFKYYFPEIHEKYFLDKGYLDYNGDERDIITKEVTLAEIELLKQLNKTVEAGIPKGNDKYWEFAFNPAYDLSLLYSQLEILRLANLLPEGEHSLHITIGDLKASKKVYHVLMVLELLFTNKERIQAGYNKDKTFVGTWAKKGDAGIYKKTHHDLTDSDGGVELRTLTIIVDHNGIDFGFFIILNELLNDIYQNKPNVLLMKAESLLKEFELPDKNWLKPYQNPEIWDKFIEHFDEMSRQMKAIVHKH